MLSLCFHLPGKHANVLRFLYMAFTLSLVAHILYEYDSRIIFYVVPALCYLLYIFLAKKIKYLVSAHFPVLVFDRNLDLPTL